MKTLRFDWIDITKGIAIILMVVGHSSIPASFSRYIWSFHMPLFFVISGFLYDADKYKRLESLIKRRIQTLIVPYVFFSIIALMGMSSLGLATWEELYKGWNGYALWFIPVLFTTEILFNRIYLILRRFNCNIYYTLEITIIVFLTVGYILSQLNIHLVFKQEVVLFALFFYGSGFIFKKLLQKISFGIIFALLSLFLQMVIVQFMPGIDMASNRFGWFIPNIMIALWGTINIIFIAKNIAVWKDKYMMKKSLIWAGKNTLIIMGLSQVVNMLLKSVCDTAYIFFSNSIIRHCLLWVILYVCSMLFNKYTPILVGKKKV